MEFKELVATRRSVRKFRPDPVPREEVRDILATAIQAPSAGNEQMWHFFVITGQNTKTAMEEIIAAKFMQVAAKAGISMDELKPVIKAATFFTGAPAVIAVATSPYRSKADQVLLQAGLSDAEVDALRVRPDLQSIGAVIQTILLAAWEKGYGTCWMCGPNIARPELERYLGIQPPQSLAALIAMGKPEIIPAARGRKPLDEVVTFFDA